MKSQRTLVQIFAVLGLVFMLAALLPLGVMAQEATGEPAPVVEGEATPEAEATPIAEPVYDLGAPPIEPTGDNSYCAVCHALPWRTATLGDGTQLNLYVIERTIENSVHGTNSESGPLGCTDCHGNNFPHGPTPETARDYALEAVNACVGCHANEARDMQLGLHEQAIMAGNLDAAVCTDCHGSHNVQPVVEQADLIAGVCGNCHESSYAEWRVSSHVDLGPLGCATCHSPHTQMIRGGATSDELCINCHEDTLPNLWVHSMHLPEDTGVTCVTCHMYPLHPSGDAEIIPVSIEDRPTGHTMHVSTVPCTTCHEERTNEEGQEVTFVEPAPETITPGTVTTVDSGAAQNAATVQLLQGLLFGLGIGATVAAIVVARGNKRE